MSLNLTFLIHKMGRIIAPSPKVVRIRRKHTVKSALCTISCWAHPFFLFLISSPVGAGLADLTGACQNQDLGTSQPQPCSSEGVSEACRIKEPAFAAGPFRASLPSGQCTSFFLTNDQSQPQMNELSRKDVTNALSLVNMILGLFSIFCSFCKKSRCASWMLLVSFLLDMAVRAMTRHLNICSKLGAELNDIAVFTTFGLASALLLGVDGPLNAFLAIIYVLAASFRLCFYSADQSYYPRDEILESERWKKMVYLGGIIVLLLCPFSLTAFYCLMWSLSYIFFPDVLWGKAACLRLQHQRN
ncbi:transmembrane protein 269 isoform X3 [Rhinolophus sinicus]|uniref:transmembrane protein 269 isoform X3 n=1 Tax=Rhinolophus sinicus TaxID=89399 RepID=UPI003D7B02CD